MRTFGLSLIVVGLALAAAPAVAVTGDNFTLASVTKGSDIYWALNDANGEKNPRLEVPAGAEVTITIKNEDDGFHNLHVMGAIGKKTEDISANGDTQMLTFTAPASGSVTYQCDYHASTMKGTIVVQGSDSGSGSGSGSEGGNDSPGVAVIGVLLAGLGAALLVRRK